MLYLFPETYKENIDWEILTGDEVDLVLSTRTDHKAD